jgi:hypothetical protein
VEVTLVVLAALDLATLNVAVGADAGCYAAFGVFFRFQVSHFDCRFRFFSLCHFVFPSYLLGCLSLVVSVTPKGN